MDHNLIGALYRKVAEVTVDLLAVMQFIKTRKTQLVSGLAKR